MEVDPEEDLTLGEDSTSAQSTSSIASSIENYMFENGHRYHAYRSGQYMYPNDEDETQREDLKHYVTRLLLEGRHCSTKFESSPGKVLDVGTGTGIWPMQFADDNPDSQVIGIDLSPIQPKWVPNNVEFQVDDIEQEWTFQDNSFDFIHIRYMGSAVRNWPELLERCKRALRPGGSIKVADLDYMFTSDDGTVTENHNMLTMVQGLSEGSSKIGVDLLGIVRQEQKLKDAGFEDIKSEVFKLPMGSWPKDPKLKAVGTHNRAQFLQGLNGIAMGLFTRLLDWKAEEVVVFVARIRNDVNNPKLHGYWRDHFTTARKPKEV